MTPLRDNIQACHEIVERGLTWLRGHTAQIAEMRDLSCHYKALYLYATLGDRISARRYLDMVVNRYLQPDGDFRTEAADKGWKHLPASPANRYIYSNGWMIVGLQKMGAYDVVQPAMRFLERFQSSDVGGFFSRFDPASGKIDQRYLDTSSTSSGGLAMLACGQVDDAVRAGDFVLRVLDAQPDMKRRYFSSWHFDDGLMTDVFGDEDVEAVRGRKHYCLSAESNASGELLWLVGKPAMFLAKLYEATNDRRYLDAAGVLVDYYDSLDESKWLNPGSCKMMWATGELFRLTGCQQYSTIACRLLDMFRQRQCECGAWVHVLHYSSLEDQPFPATADIVQELLGEISDTIFNLVAADEDKQIPQSTVDKAYLSFETLSKHYEYDPTLPLSAELSEPKPVEGGRTYSVTFRGSDGLMVYGDVTIPDCEGPHRLLIAPPYMAGVNLARHGVMTAWIDYRLTNRDAREGLSGQYATTPGVLLWARINTIMDFRRLLDWLMGEFEIDRERVCFAGASKGAMMGTILGAVDRRIKQFVLRAGGADMVMFVERSGDDSLKALCSQPWYSAEFWRAFMAPFDCQHFVHKLAPRPVLFLFGRQDTVVPTVTFDKMLELAGEPKKVIWYEAGHGLRAAGLQPTKDARTWLAEVWDAPEIVADSEDSWVEVPEY